MTDTRDKTLPKFGLYRLPGQFQGWDILPMLNGTASFHIEPEGQTADGEPLYAVWRSPSDLCALLRVLT